MIECLSDVSAARLFVDADVVDIQRLGILQQRMVADLRQLAEGMPEYLAVVIDEDGIAVVSDELGQLLLAILGGVALEQVRPDVVMNGIYLMQQTHQPLDVPLFCFPNHGFDAYAKQGRSFFCTRYSPIWTALRAAPLRIWSPESQKVSPLSSARSLRTRPT